MPWQQRPPSERKPSAGTLDECAGEISARTFGIWDHGAGGGFVPRYARQTSSSSGRISELALDQQQQFSGVSTGSEVDAQEGEEATLATSVFDRVESAGGRTLARAMGLPTGNYDTAGVTGVAYGQLLGSLNVCN